MYALFDNIAATIIGGTVVLILAVISFRGQETSIDSTQYVTAKTRSVEFARQLMQDFNNIGSGLDSTGIASGDAFQTVDFATNDEFSFRVSQAAFASSEDASVTGVADDGHYDVIGPAGGTRLVCYEKVDLGTTAQVLDEDAPTPNTYETVSLFRIDRKEAAGSATGCSGTATASSGPLTNFTVILRSQPGILAASPAAAREVEVRVRMISPLAGGRTEAQGGMRQHIDQTRWSRVFRPANLQRTH